MIAGREANFTRVLDSIESCLHLVAEKESEARHRTIESEEVTLPNSDREITAVSSANIAKCDDRSSLRDVIYVQSEKQSRQLPCRKAATVVEGRKNPVFLCSE
ncbi:hypothetical protein TNCV_3395971 [Trichonephila clavipes]|nr:hypothetical protein TNCV_3395971 [Trichonephila clavipes]